MSEKWLGETAILDFSSGTIQHLIESRQWQSLETFEAIGTVYSFVKDDIAFGYNRTDDLQASLVLSDGYGQCNTKANLLMALLRAFGIECRIHGFTIDKALQKGAIPVGLYQLAPRRILHSWVEVNYRGRWLNLEGFIIDADYMASIQSRYSRSSVSFCGYGIATACLRNPNVEWRGKSTYIQKQGIVDDFGIFMTPINFTGSMEQIYAVLKRIFYAYIGRHIVNWNVNRIRQRVR